MRARVVDTVGPRAVAAPLNSSQLPRHSSRSQSSRTETFAYLMNLSRHCHDCFVDGVRTYSGRVWMEHEGPHVGKCKVCVRVRVCPCVCVCLCVRVRVCVRACVKN